MIYKFNFSISGEVFWPKKIINKIQGDFIIDSYFNSTDKKFDNKPDEYGYGGMSFWHPQKFALESSIIEYEKAFVDFIEKNHQLFIESGIDDFQLFMEIYYDGGQCNFEIFSKELLKKLADSGISISVSIYELRDEELRLWESEIELEWKNC